VTPSRTARILIADDHQIVREGIRTLLARSRPQWEICGDAQDGAQAIHLAQSLKPDLVMMDITMPEISGLDAVSRLRQAGFDRPVLIFTMHESSRLVTEVQQAGAQGYVLKSQAVQDLVRAIDALLGGGTFFYSPPGLGPAPEELKKPGPIFCACLLSAVLVAA
jgi:DNA-binding NarL/FixJ family response regulator